MRLKCARVHPRTMCANVRVRFKMCAMCAFKGKKGKQPPHARADAPNFSSRVMGRKRFFGSDNAS
jgi:hypothetical protein